ncbi:MAG: Imm8 family immunity protein [Marmoricola sp.]
MAIGSIEDITCFLNWIGGNPANGDEDFLTDVQVLIGLAGREGADSFDLTVCSPNRLAEHFSPLRWAPTRTSGWKSWVGATCSRFAVCG